MIVSETETHEPHNIIDIEGSSELHHLQRKVQQDRDTIEQLRDQQKQDKFKLDQFDWQLQESEESVARLQEQLCNVQLQQQDTRDEPELSQIQQQLQQLKEIQQQQQQLNETVRKLQQKRTKGRSIFRKRTLALLLVSLLLAILLLLKCSFDDPTEINVGSETSGLSSLDVQ